MNHNVANMYEQLPEELTGKFSIVEDTAGGIVLKHKSLHINIGLDEITKVPTGQLKFQANVYAPLENMTTPEEGIVELRTLQSRDYALRSRGYSGRHKGTFNHYDGGVEFVYHLQIESVDHLQRVLRSFTFFPDNDEEERT